MQLLGLLLEKAGVGQRKWVFDRFAFSVAMLAMEALLIVGCAVMTGITYYLCVYKEVGDVAYYAAVGISLALLFSLPSLVQDDYKFQSFLDGKRTPARTFLLWNYAFLCLAIIGFMTKTTGIASRGWIAAFYVSGLVAVLALDVVVSRLLGAAIARGRVASRRLMLVGSHDEISRMKEAVEQPGAGVRVVATAVLSQNDCGQSLADAIDRARALAVEDVVILTDWSRGAFIQKAVDAFTVLPVGIHLGASSVIGRFNDARVAKFGTTSALSLTLPPLSPLQSLVKRAFDLSVASLALVLLAPLFLAIAVSIKRDSAGPVFFRQRRRGYNLQEFRIWKFRTMTTLDDGDVVKQATVGDVRVTKVGSILRRTNLDELPQLFNVMTGDMSLVGPRPHHVSHDLLFEQRIAKYSRRLNVRPGMTGWAQVNGHRGPTETDAAMQARVEHDLYYIDNWSIAFDIYLMIATVVSRKAFQNAH